MARPNCVRLSPETLLGILTRKMPCLSLPKAYSVEGYRLAIALKISLRRCAVAEKALASHEQQLQQFASSIVDKHQQHTARSASFEPVVR